MAASTAPSGAHKQPWTFCLISNKELKSHIRSLAEEEEKKSYGGRMSDRWLKDLAPLGTDWVKNLLMWPLIVIVMKRAYEFEDGKKYNNYYVSEFGWFSRRFFIDSDTPCWISNFNTYTKPMNFLAKALNRPDNERPFLLLPVGYPAEEVTVPDLARKPLKDVVCYYE